jgi:hypothetical protein
MGCGCKGNKPKQEQPTQPPVSIRLTEVQQPSTSQSTPQTTSTNN